MNRRKCLVTITDGISPTSMPFNEFILYRLKKYPEEKQVLIQIFEKGIVGDVKIPSDVGYFSLGVNVWRFNKLIRELEKRYDVISYHIHEGKSVILFSIASLLRYRAKSIYTIHSTYRNYPFHNKLFSFIGSLLAGKVVCVSETSYKYLPRILKIIRKSNVLSIQNGVDLDRINNVEVTINSHDKFIICYVARFDWMKRHEMLLSICRSLDNYELNLIGEGPLEQRIRDKVTEYSLDNCVNFLGLLKREDVYRELKQCDMFISTSCYEGLPIGVLEAMGCGAPCIVSNIEQHAEIAQKCPSLYLCPDDIGQWVDSIKHFQQLTKTEINMIREKNKKTVADFFSLHSMHDHYNQLYYMIK